MNKSRPSSGKYFMNSYFWIALDMQNSDLADSVALVERGDQNMFYTINRDFLRDQPTCCCNPTNQFLSVAWAIKL